MKSLWIGAVLLLAQASPAAVVLCSTSQKSETSTDANVLTCPIPAQAGRYRVRFVMKTSASSAATFGWTATWVDSNGYARTPANLPLFVGPDPAHPVTHGPFAKCDGVPWVEFAATPALTYTTTSGPQAFWGCEDIDVNNSGASIVVKFTFSGESISARVSATVERIIVVRSGKHGVL